MCLVTIFSSVANKYKQFSVAAVLFLVLKKQCPNKKLRIKKSRSKRGCSGSIQVGRSVYKRPRSTRKDYAIALQWYHKAAAQDDSEARSLL
jgi:hypothetical protein